MQNESTEILFLVIPLSFFFDLISPLFHAFLSYRGVGARGQDLPAPPTSFKEAEANLPSPSPNDCWCAASRHLSWYVMCYILLGNVFATQGDPFKFKARAVSYWSKFKAP